MVSPSRRLVDPPASVRKWQVRELAATGVTPAPIYFNPPPNPLVNPFWTNPTSNSIGSEARNPMAESLPQKVSSSVIGVAMKVASVNFEGDWMNRSA